jgi:hypothetical protein
MDYAGDMSTPAASPAVQPMVWRFAINQTPPPPLTRGSAFCLKPCTPVDISASAKRALRPTHNVSVQYTENSVVAVLAEAGQWVYNAVQSKAPFCTAVVAVTVSGTDVVRATRSQQIGHPAGAQVWAARNTGRPLDIVVGSRPADYPLLLGYTSTDTSYNDPTYMVYFTGTLRAQTKLKSISAYSSPLTVEELEKQFKSFLKNETGELTADNYVEKLMQRGKQTWKNATKADRDRVLAETKTGDNPEDELGKLLQFAYYVMFEPVAKCFVPEGIPNTLNTGDMEAFEAFEAKMENREIKEIFWSLPDNLRIFHCNPFDVGEFYKEYLESDRELAGRLCSFEKRREALQTEVNRGKIKEVHAQARIQEFKHAEADEETLSTQEKIDIFTARYGTSEFVKAIKPSDSSPIPVSDDVSSDVDGLPPLLGDSDGAKSSNDVAGGDGFSDDVSSDDDGPSPLLGDSDGPSTEPPFDPEILAQYADTTSEARTVENKDFKKYLEREENQKTLAGRIQVCDNENPLFNTNQYLTARGAALQDLLETYRSFETDVAMVCNLIIDGQVPEVQFEALFEKRTEWDKKAPYCRERAFARNRIGTYLTDVYRELKNNGFEAYRVISTPLRNPHGFDGECIFDEHIIALQGKYPEHAHLRAFDCTSLKPFVHTYPDFENGRLIYYKIDDEVVFSSAIETRGSEQGFFMTVPPAALSKDSFKLEVFNDVKSIEMKFERGEIKTLADWDDVSDKNGWYKVQSEYVTKGFDNFKWIEGRGNSGWPGGFLFRPNQFEDTEFSIHPFQIDDLVECTYNTVAGSATTGPTEKLEQMAIFKWRRANIQGVVTVLNTDRKLRFSTGNQTQFEALLPTDQEVLKYTYNPISHDWKENSFTKNIPVTKIEFQRSIGNVITILNGPMPLHSLQMENVAREMNLPILDGYPNNYFKMYEVPATDETAEAFAEKLKVAAQRIKTKLQKGKNQPLFSREQIERFKLTFMGYKETGASLADNADNAGAAAAAPARARKKRRTKEI